MRQKEIDAARDLERVQSVVEEIDNLTVVIKATVDENGTLYGSVDKDAVYQAITDLGFEIEQSNVKLDEPIKELGEYPMKLQFDHGLEADITV